MGTTKSTGFPLNTSTLADDIAERDAIPAAQRTAGMLVRTASDGVTWRLAADLTTWINDNTKPEGDVRYVGAGADIDVYVESTGSDDNDGSSVAKAWKTTERVVADFPQVIDKHVRVNYGQGTFNGPYTTVRPSSLTGIIGVSWLGALGTPLTTGPLTFSPKAGFDTVHEATGTAFSPNITRFSHFAEITLAGFSMAKSVYPSTSPQVETSFRSTTAINAIYPYTTFWQFPVGQSAIGFPASVRGFDHFVRGIKLVASGSLAARVVGGQWWGVAMDTGSGNISYENASVQDGDNGATITLSGGKILGGIVSSLDVLRGDRFSTHGQMFLTGAANAGLFRVEGGSAAGLAMPIDIRNTDVGSDACGLSVGAGSSASVFGSLKLNVDGCQRGVIVEGGNVDFTGSVGMNGTVPSVGVELRNGAMAKGVGTITTLTATGGELKVGSKAPQTFASVPAAGSVDATELCLARL